MSELKVFFYTQVHPFKNGPWWYFIQSNCQTLLGLFLAEVGVLRRELVGVSVFQYRIGQLYMISKHSHEQSDRGEGVEVVQNEPFEDPEHGQGQFTEKRVYLNRSVFFLIDSCCRVAAHQH